MFYSHLLSKFTDIKHCFFSRKNGVSKGIYESLNCGTGSKDTKKKVLENLKIVSNHIGCDNKDLITLNQKHSDKVIYFKNYFSIKNKIAGDAIVTGVENIGLGVLTADCVPILFYDPINKLIGCAHVGWKGALKGIVKNTIKKFNELNCKIENLNVVIGPCIKKQNYEVGLDFYKKFINQNRKNEECFTKIKHNKYTFDLRKFINIEVINLNIKNLDNIELDTFSQKENFF